MAYPKLPKLPRRPLRPVAALLTVLSALAALLFFPAAARAGVQPVNSDGQQASVVDPYTGHLDVFAVAFGGQVLVDQQQSDLYSVPWSGFSGAVLGSGAPQYGFTGMPAAIYDSETHRLDLFVLSYTDGFVYLDQETAAGVWTGFTRLADSVGGWQSSPVVYDAFGTIEVFESSGSLSVAMDTETAPGVWSGFDAGRLGSGNHALGFAPAVANNPATGYPQIFMTGSFGALYVDQQTGPNTWSGFSAVPLGAGNSGFSGTPSVTVSNVIVSSAYVAVFVDNRAGGISVDIEDGYGAWSGFGSSVLGPGSDGAYSPPVASQNPANDQPMVYARGADGTVYVDSRTSQTGPWTGFTALDGTNGWYAITAPARPLRGGWVAALGSGEAIQVYRGNGFGRDQMGAGNANFANV
ncbi:hypothetical protein GCM10009839_64960 [Catenulispora yoronensis]|uniref:PLL-like beta propeller domain-containing protein n=1 Tax=Catenulispora yoronensis TaxID=450799 RepID=A0ABN2V2R8_9ACTN